MSFFSTKNLFTSFLLIFFIIGSVLSVNVGISHDEWHEEQNWKYNLEISKETKDKMNNSEEFLRKELANKYKDMEKKVEGFE